MLTQVRELLLIVRGELYCLKDDIERAILDESSTFGGDTGIDADFGMK